MITLVDRAQGGEHIFLLMRICGFTGRETGFVIVNERKDVGHLDVRAGSEKSSNNCVSFNGDPARHGLGCGIGWREIRREFRMGIRSRLSPLLQICFAVSGARIALVAEDGVADGEMRWKAENQRADSADRELGQKQVCMQ
jgi:hypothetical protein